MPTPINISASRGAAILGLSSWTTPVNVWLQIMESREPGFCKKRGYIFPEFEENAVTRWGTAFEDAIIELAENKSGMHIRDREKLYSKFDYLTCHIDGNYAPGFCLHEGKTTSFFYWKDNFGEPETDKVPIEYQIQCQHQMICTGAEKVILSVLVFPKRVEEWEELGWEIKEDDGIYRICDYQMNRDLMPDVSPLKWAVILNQMGYFHQYHIEANKELQSLMIDHYREFWNNNVVKGIEPAPQSYDDMGRCSFRRLLSCM